MTSIDNFLTLVNAEIGLNLGKEDIGRDFDQLAGWDSLHLLTLLTALEQATGHSVSMPDVLEATNLEDIYDLAVGT